MNSFSFAGSGSDLPDEYSGWMDGCIPPPSPLVYQTLCYGLNHDQTDARGLFSAMMNQCQAETSHCIGLLFTGVSSAPRAGWEGGVRHIHPAIN